MQTSRRALLTAAGMATAGLATSSATEPPPEPFYVLQLNHEDTRFDVSLKAIAINYDMFSSVGVSLGGVNVLVASVDPAKLQVAVKQAAVDTLASVFGLQTTTRHILVLGLPF